MNSNSRIQGRSNQVGAWIGFLLIGLSASLSAQTSTAFNADVDASGEIYALAVQLDGKILVGGQIYQVAGQWRRSITRLKPDGSLDLDFQGSAGGEHQSNPFVKTIIVQPDGKILVFGNFTALSGQARTNFGRLNANGTLDSTFNPQAGPDHLAFSALLALQPDGKILTEAWVEGPGGQWANFLVRLNNDGTLDQGFLQPAIGPGQYAQIRSLALLEDGEMLVGGQFASIGGQAVTNLARLSINGWPDRSFAPPSLNQAAPWSWTGIETLAVQPNGAILIGGSFVSVNGVARTNFARLNTDGTLDTAFNPDISHGIGVRDVSAIALQADGRMVLGGYFGWTAAGDRFGLGRLNPDGSPDDSFDASVWGEWIHAVTVQPDGKVLVGGDIWWLGAPTHTGVARVDNTEATQRLILDGSTINWMRGGASPEVGRTSFEYSTNGLDWLNIGAGRRVAGGWQCVSTCPPEAAIRARGFVQCGEYNRSGWFTETIIGRPGITTSPVSRTNNAGTIAEFIVVGGGTPPVSYQWLKNGVLLVDGGNISGAGLPVLTLSNVVAGDMGGYSVVVSNEAGTVTSAIATLTVRDPAINKQPVSQLAQGGRPATLSLEAGGTPPMSYQWRKDGADLPGATAATLDFAPVQWTNRGSYLAVVSNRFGCLTSEVAVLDVNMAPPDAFYPTNISGAVLSLAVQPDGKILAASEWSEVSEASRCYFTRVNPDGTPDNTFNASLDPDHGAVLCMAVQPGGKVLAGGWFTSLGGGACSNLARLNSDGTLDTTWLLEADSTVRCLMSLPHGKTLVWGDFTNLCGLPCPTLGRLNADGTLDTGFQAQPGGILDALLGALPDGKLIVGLHFTNSSGQWLYRLERLMPDGSIDPSYANPEVQRASRPGSGWGIWSAVQADGKLLVSGTFDGLAGVACTNFGRLNPDGTFDSTFIDPHPTGDSGGPGSIEGFALQTDGRIVVGGYFRSLAGQPREYLGRLEADGSLDETFHPNGYQASGCFAVQPDGKILAASWPLVRLNNSGPATETLVCDGSTISWLRIGTCPEIWCATFESSIDGVNWSNLGVGTHVPGGWQLTGVSLPVGATVRARGLVAVSGSNWLMESISSWFVESVAKVGGRAQPRTFLDLDGFGVRPNEFAFAVSANPREAVIVECSRNLINWTPMATNVLGVGPMQFKDPMSSAAPQQFYRARLWP